MTSLRTISCANPECRKDFSTDREDAKYCPECEPYMKREKESKKPPWKTISIRRGVRQELLELQNDIIRKEGERIGYSDIIHYGLSIAQRSQDFLEELIVMLRNDKKI